jgi:DNA primase
MAIPEEDVARVRAATDIAALVGEHSSLKRVGLRLTGLCPFHQEKSPSFSVNPQEGLYYCFGCGASGDAISFVRAVDGVDFVEAVERLAARAGVTVRHDSAGSAAAKADHARRQSLLDTMADAVAFYHDRLLNHPDAGGARQYLRSRGYDGDVVRRFSLGWSPTVRDALVKSLDRPSRAIRETGLGYPMQSGALGDSFRGRVIFPIFDTSGRPIALGGRILPGSAGEGPKYRNSPETPIYSKRRTLYGLNWAKTVLLHSPEVVVCEGYTDVIGFFGAGVERAVATCGTSLTEDHLRVLGSFAKRVVLAFDADEAGRSAAGRIYESERRHGLEIAVAALPAGRDPADLAREDPELLRKAVETAVPYLTFRIDRAMGGEDLRTAEGQVRAAESALAMVAEHPNDLVRDQYVVQVADRTKIEPDRLRERLAALRRGESGGGPVAPVERARASDVHSGQAGPGGGTAPPKVRAPGRSEAYDPEVRALTLAIQRPAEMAPYLDEVLFSAERTKDAFRALCSADDLHTAIDGADPETADLLRRLAVSEPEDDVDGAIVALVREAAARAVADLEREARSAARDGDAEPARVREISSELDWLHPTAEQLNALDDAARAADTGALLAWLIRHDQEAR